MNTVTKKCVPSYLVKIWNAEYGDVEDTVVASTFQEGVAYVLDSIGRSEAHTVEAQMRDGFPSLTVMKGQLTLASIELSELTSVVSVEVAAAVARLLQGEADSMVQMFTCVEQWGEKPGGQAEETERVQSSLEVVGAEDNGGSLVSQILVCHWGSKRYTGNEAFGSMQGDYVLEVDDRRKVSGQLWVTTCPESGETDDMLSICMEVGNIQASEGSTQVAHVHLGSDDVLFSIFKRADSLAIRLGYDVTLKQEVLDDKQIVWTIA